MPVQVNGKVRGRIAVDPDASDAEVEALALADPGVQPYLKDREVTKVVIAKGRLISIVVR
jgi:leucyl-tRNA synthetase